MSTTAFDPSALARDLLHCFRNQKDLADRALAQLSDAAFLAPGAGAVDPIAITVKHVGGNLRSRWRDFLTTDGEKRDRNRDGFRDLVSAYVEGELRRQEEDTNADGQPDVVEIFASGERRERHQDLDFDGQLDVSSFYEGGKLVRRELRSTEALNLWNGPESQ